MALSKFYIEEIYNLFASLQIVVIIKMAEESRNYEKERTQNLMEKMDEKEHKGGRDLDVGVII
jgi:hypothetical protein